MIPVSIMHFLGSRMVDNILAVTMILLMLPLETLSATFIMEIIII